MSNSLPKLIVIVGPTASGKTEAGIRLAKEMNGAVVSADSRQVYVGMNVGTAKPLGKLSKHKRAQSTNKTQYTNRKSQTDDDYTLHQIMTPDVVGGIDHYLFNIRRPDDQLTLAEWQKAAFSVIDQLVNRNIAPLLVGGTMLYVDSVVFNYDIPSVEANKQLREELESKRIKDLYKDLLAKDPQAKDFVQSQNKRRIIRALEVIEATGKSFSHQRKVHASRYDVQMIGIFPGWEKLAERIRQRAQQMLTGDLLEEVKRLQKKYGKELPLLQTMNYKQGAAVIAGEMTQEEAIEKMVSVNTRYARRQMSWWRGRKEIVWIDSPEKILELI
jgi:tRNA dimethylallyltransferase